MVLTGGPPGSGRRTGTGRASAGRGSWLRLVIPDAGVRRVVRLVARRLGESGQVIVDIWPWLGRNRYGW